MCTFSDEQWKLAITDKERKEREPALRMPLFVNASY